MFSCTWVSVCLSASGGCVRGVFEKPLEISVKTVKKIRQKPKNRTKMEETANRKNVRNRKITPLCKKRPKYHQTHHFIFIKSLAHNIGWIFSERFRRAVQLYTFEHQSLIPLRAQRFLYHTRVLWLCLERYLEVEEFRFLQKLSLSVTYTYSMREIFCSVATWFYTGRIS